MATKNATKMGACALLLGCMSMTAYAENLADIYALSKQNDPKYKAARFEFEAVGFTEIQARAGLLPSVTLEASHTKTKQNILDSKNTVFGSGSSDYPTDNRTLTITQPLFKLAAWRGYQQAKAAVKQAAATFGAAEQDLVLRTATAYLEVLAAQDALIFARSEKDAIKRQFDVTQQKRKSGLATAANLNDAEARYALTEADEVAAQNDLDDKQQALQELTGKPVATLATLTADMPLVQPEPADITKWVSSAIEQNLALEARRQAVEVAQREVDRQRAGHYPVLDLSATKNRRTTGGSLFGGGSDVDTTELMVRLNVPIYAGGGTQAIVEESAKRYQGALEDLERDRRQTERQTRAAFQGVTGGIVRVKALTQSVVAQESARKLKVEGYKSGLETVLAVLDAERDLYAAKRDFAQSRYDFLLNRLRLKQAIGTLGEADLVAVNELMK